MGQYIYEAVDPMGQQVGGEISAANVSEAVNSLERQGLSVLSISATDRQAVSMSTVEKTGRTSSREPGDASLDRHFDAVLERRDTLVPALNALVSELPSGRTKREIEQLISIVSTAQSGAELRTNDKTVRWLPLLSAGFSSENSTRRLGDLVDYATRDLQIRSERNRLLAYPIILTVMAMFVLGWLCLLVVPIFDNMFGEFGLRLPAPTRAIVGLTRQLQSHPLRTLLIICGVAASLYGAIRMWTHFSMTTRLFGFAVSGNSSSVSAMSSLTGQLAELLQIGVSRPDAIWIAGHGCENYYFKKASEQLARDAYSQDRPLSQSPAASSFPANVIRALEVGPGRPNVGLLRELSAMYAQRVYRRVDWSTGAVAQISIVVLGAIVAFMVIALFMPLVSLISSLT